jgi:hypothetical protein
MNLIKILFRAKFTAHANSCEIRYGNVTACAFRRCRMKPVWVWESRLKMWARCISQLRWKLR